MLKHRAMRSPFEKVWRDEKEVQHVEFTESASRFVDGSMVHRLSCDGRRKRAGHVLSRLLQRLYRLMGRIIVACVAALFSTSNLLLKQTVIKFIEFANLHIASRHYITTSRMLQNGNYDMHLPAQTPSLGCCSPPHTAQLCLVIQCYIMSLDPPL